jgi:hypothetical protein
LHALEDHIAEAHQADERDYELPPAIPRDADPADPDVVFTNGFGRRPPRNE